MKTFLTATLLALALFITGCALTSRYTTTEADPVTGQERTVQHDSPLVQGAIVAGQKASTGDWVGALVGGVGTCIAGLFAAQQAMKNRKHHKAATAAVDLAEKLKTIAATSHNPAVQALLDNARDEQDASGVRNIVQRIRTRLTK